MCFKGPTIQYFVIRVMKTNVSEVVCRDPGSQPDKMRAKNVLSANRQLEKVGFFVFFFNSNGLVE